VISTAEVAVGVSTDEEAGEENNTDDEDDTGDNANPHQDRVQAVAPVSVRRRRLKDASLPGRCCGLFRPGSRDSVIVQSSPTLEAELQGIYALSAVETVTFFQRCQTPSSTYADESIW